MEALAIPVIISEILFYGATAMSLILLVKYCVQVLRAMTIPDYVTDDMIVLYDMSKMIRNIAIIFFVIIMETYQSDFSFFGVPLLEHLVFTFTIFAYILAGLELSLLLMLIVLSIKREISVKLGAFVKKNLFRNAILLAIVLLLVNFLSLALAVL